VKLTETQKNFKRQMAEIKPKEKSIYDTTRSGNPFGDEGKTRQRNNTVTRMLYFFAIPICSLLIPYVFSHVAPTSVAKSTEQVALAPAYPVSTSASTPVVSSVTNKRLVSKEDASYLNSFKVISVSVKSISKYQMIPYEQRNLSSYKADLLSAIVLCDNETNKLAGIKPTTIFQPIATLAIEYIANSRNAYKYQLNYIGSRSISDNDLANKYITMMNQNSYEFLPLLIQIFKNNDYSYTVLGDGQVSYSLER